ncbi:uncharacterized protein LOC104423214 isoform X7 [Eucalyptus grandis]|uniref:uncharacterized protein LOC104423214 isoform X7 n=1 Tax=Eucalyptus grandis TaxID=71139 RepID=UPI00192E957E|nr:uncharacterized protein LOC104423214 isoform X7 [Eucalyptus grandis]
MASSSSSFERSLEAKLRWVGNGLLNAPSSGDELLALLEVWLPNLPIHAFAYDDLDAEYLLANMEQGPSDPLQDSLLPLMKALIADSLLKHSVEGVRVSVTYCFSEVLRISAPQEPYNDDQMKVIFELIVEAFSKLSQPSMQYYEKVLSILETVARVRACLLMLDLQCNALVVQMFQNFWAIIRSDPTEDVLWAVEQIMMDILGESEEISLGLLSPLLASVLKENKAAHGLVFSPGEVVPDLDSAPGSSMSDAAALLFPDIVPVAKTSTDDADSADSKGSTELEIDFEAIPKKREPKPNKLMNPDEGYKLSWLRVNRQKSGRRKVHSNGHNLSAAPKISSRKRRTPQKVNVEPDAGETTVACDGEALVARDLAGKKSKLSIVGGRMSNFNKAVSEGSGVPGRRLVGRKIKVWWPLDEMFYHGVVQSYDPFRKRHKVLYDDGDTETLNLHKERWEFVEDDLPDEQRWEADLLKPESSPVKSSPVKREYKKGSSKKSHLPRKLMIKQNIERAEASSRVPEVIVPQFGNQNVGRDESSDDESTEDNLYELRVRSNDVQQKYPSSSSSDDSTPEASPPRPWWQK